MNFSYDYSELIDEIKSDLSEGLINLSDTIKVIRSHKITYEDYRPIIDYYYDDDQPKEEYQPMLVETVLSEMEFRNQITKTRHGGKRPGAGRPATGAMPTKCFRMTGEEYQLVKQFLAELRSKPESET